MEISKINEISINEIFKDGKDFMDWFKTKEVKKELEKLVGLKLEEVREWCDPNPDYTCIHSRDTKYSLSALFFISFHPDHKKAIGNLITCRASGATGESIVWITDKATEEDWNVITWLDTYINDHIMFYLVELHFFSIKGSDPAYQLRTVYEPNYDSELYKMKMESRRKFLEVIGELNKNEVKTDS